MVDRDHAPTDTADLLRCGRRYGLGSLAATSAVDLAEAGDSINSWELVRSLYAFAENLRQALYCATSPGRGSR
jgi:hypothetical protein